MEQENNKNKSLPISIVVVVVLVVIGFYLYQSKRQVATKVMETTESSMTETNTNSMGVVSYKDGTYKADGNYVSPGGPRDIGVTITLKNGVVTDSTFEGRATDPQSKRFQGEFSDNYKAMIVGKNISEVTLTKVSGSSLTPKGFMDALNKIKVEAKI